MKTGQFPRRDHRSSAGRNMGRVLGALDPGHRASVAHSDTARKGQRLNDLLKDKCLAGRIEIHEEVMKMHDRLLRRRQVEEITGLSRSSIYRLMQDGGFPRPVKVGPAAVRWRASDITAWLESRPVAKGEFEPPKAA